MSQIKAEKHQHPRVDRAPGILDRLFGPKPPALRTGIDLERTREQQGYALRFTACWRDIIRDFDRQRTRKRVLAAGCRDAVRGEEIACAVLSKHLATHFSGQSMLRSGAHYNALMGTPRSLCISLTLHSPRLRKSAVIQLEPRL